MKWLKRVLVLLLLVVGYIYFTQIPKLNIISGYASKYMATSVYYSGHSLDHINAPDHNVPLIKLASTVIDEKTHSSSADVFGLMNRTAVYKEGIGSLLVQDQISEINSLVAPDRTFDSSPLPYPHGQGAALDTLLSNVDYDALEKAIATAFENNDIQKTRSVLVLYKGYLLGERYSDPYTKDTPILGWSMTKSIVATLYGILEHRGLLSVSDPLSIDSWKSDERSKLTINHLLRMQSGLEWSEDYGGISDVTKMLFLSSDMGAVQAEKKLIAQPTEIWNYSSGTSNLLSKNLKSYFDSQQAYIDFMYTDFADQIGMNSLLVEQDGSGSYVGSSYGWASTRDWGRFGQLYLQKGMWNGKALFDSSWVDYISTPTEHSEGGYGAHFWLNAGGVYPNVPKDLYSANGHDGQFVYVIPSKELVVVRTGLSEGSVYNADLLLSEIIKSIEY